MVDDDEIPDKSKVQYEHLKRVKEQMAAEEEALKATKIVKGADTKNYKQFSDKYVRPPEMELSDEMKLRLSRRYEILTAFMGFVGLGLTFFVIYYSKLHLSILDNFIIVLTLYNPTLHLSIYKNYFAMEMNLILLGCTLVTMSIIMIIFFQRKYDKISDRIRAGRSPKIGVKKAKPRSKIVTALMGVVGVGLILFDVHYLRQYISILDNFAIVLSFYDSTLYFSFFKSLVIKINLILLGCLLVATGVWRVAGSRRGHS